MKVNFMSLASGSSGNCYYLATDNTAILIDAGVGIRAIKKVFREYALNLSKVEAVFITHDHADHIKAAGHLGEKHGIPVYSTREIHKGMQRNYSIRQKLTQDHIRYIRKEEPVALGDFRITCFEVPHDGTDNVGYCVQVGEKTFSFLTDIGHITPTAVRYAEQADYLIIEANYDEEMLNTGPYPPHLKARIAGPDGHLGNRELAEFLASHFTDKLKYVWLCHLSQENNHPELALKTVEQALRKRGITAGQDVQVIPLRRLLPTGMYTFE